MRTLITRPLATIVVAAAGTLAAASLAGCGSVPPPGQAAGSQATGTITRPAAKASPRGPVLGYVLNTPPCTGRSVTPVNVSAGRALRPIRVGRGVSAIVVSPNGKTVYVSSGQPVTNGTFCATRGPGQPANTITPIDAATGQAGTPINAGRDPGPMVITPDGRTGYVLSPLASTVTPIRLKAGRAGKPIHIGGYPDAIAITPDGKTVYVASNLGLIPISTATNTAGTPIRIGGRPTAIAITPDGSTAYVTTGRGIVPVRTATSTPGQLIRVGKFPGPVALTPNGKAGYVASSAGVTPISTVTNTAGHLIRVYAGPISIAPNGRTAYVIGYDTAAKTDAVTPIAIATNTAGRAIPVRYRPGVDLAGIGFGPDGKTAFILNEIFEPGSSVGTLIPLHLATNTLGTPIKVGVPSSSRRDPVQ